MRDIDSNKNISLTRGDWLPLRLNLINKKDKTDYIADEGDIVRFTVYKNKDVENVIYQEDFPLNKGDTYVDIDIYSDETKFGEYINKTEEYCYQVELNPGTQFTITLLGVERINGKDVPKYFYLIPEAGDK